MVQQLKKRLFWQVQFMFLRHFFPQNPEKLSVFLKTANQDCKNLNKFAVINFVHAHQIYFLALLLQYQNLNLALKLLPFPRAKKSKPSQELIIIYVNKIHYHEFFQVFTLLAKSSKK